MPVCFFKLGVCHIKHCPHFSHSHRLKVMTEIAAGCTEVRCAEVLEALMKDSKLSSDKSSDEILQTNEEKKRLKESKAVEARRACWEFHCALAGKL